MDSHRVCLTVGCALCAFIFAHQVFVFNLFSGRFPINHLPQQFPVNVAIYIYVYAMVPSSQSASRRRTIICQKFRTMCATQRVSIDKTTTQYYYRNCGWCGGWCQIEVVEIVGGVSLSIEGRVLQNNESENGKWCAYRRSVYLSYPTVGDCSHVSQFDFK